MTEAEYVARGHGDLVRASWSEGNGIWAASLSISSPHAVHRGATSLIAGSKPTWREQLYELPMPMPKVVICGEASLPHADTERLPRAGVNVDVVPAAGHAMAWQNPSGLALALQLVEWSDAQRAPERAALVSSSLWEKRIPNSMTAPSSKARMTDTSATSTIAWARSEPNRFAKTNATPQFYAAGLPTPPSSRILAAELAPDVPELPEE